MQAMYCCHLLPYGVSVTLRFIEVYIAATHASIHCHAITLVCVTPRLHTPCLTGLLSFTLRSALSAVISP